MAEHVTVAKAYVQLMPSMEGATSNITNALVGSVGKAGSQAGLNFGNQFGAMSSKMLAKLGGAFVAMFAVDKIAEAFQNVEAGFNNVIKATGATGDAAKDLESVYLNVSKSVVGSYEDIGSAVGELNTRLDLQGEDLEKASEAMMKYAKVTGQDATKATQDIASMMRNVGIPTEELTTTLDKMTKAGQAAGVDVSSLANNITKYNAVMKEMGLETDEQIALMAQFEKSGADTATILNAMKKGVASWAKEGKDAGEEFRAFVQGVQDGTVTAGDAVELFGSKGGLSMYEAAKKGQLSFEEMYDQIANGSEGALDTVYNNTLTAQEKFGLLGKQVETGFYQILEPIVDAVAPHMDEIIEAVRAVVEFIVGVIEFIGGIPDTVNGFIDTMYNSVNGFVQGIVDFCTSIYDTVTGAFELVSTTVSNIWNGIQSTISGIWNGITSTVRGAVSTVKNTVSSVFNSVKSTVTSIWNGIKNAITKPIETAKNLVKGAIKTISDIITGANLQLPHIKVPEFIIEGGEVPWGIGGLGKAPRIDIKWHARGGIVNGPSLIGAGEAGPEAIVPLSQPYIEPWADAVAEEVGTDDVIRWLGANLPRIIENYTPTIGERDFNRLARKAFANGSI